MYMLSEYNPAVDWMLLISDKKRFHGQRSAAPCNFTNRMKKTKTYDGYINL